MGRHLAAQDRLVASNLLEAELRAACAREEVRWDPALVSAISWLLPGRLLSDELARVLAAGYLRGADLWHIACALFVAGEIGAPVEFLTLDERQRAVAVAVGLPSPRF